MVFTDGTEVFVTFIVLTLIRNVGMNTVTTSHFACVLHIRSHWTNEKREKNYVSLFGGITHINFWILLYGRGSGDNLQYKTFIYL